VDNVEILERHSFDIGIWGQLTQVIRERHIDIVHAHEYKTDLLAWVLARRTGVIPLSTVHGWSGYSTREHFLYYPADKWLLARFPRVVAVSTPIKDELVRCGADPARVEVILNAIDTMAFRSEPAKRRSIRQLLGLTDEQFVIGAVGRLEREKRFDLLIEAFAQVAGQHPASRLVIVGEGGLRQELESLAARLGVSASCRLLGHRTDVVDLYQSFDVFVQSSETEGTPNCVLEAMAMVVPLVATDVGGTRELARADVDGLIVRRHDVAALKSAIESVLRDPADARARALSARTRVETELSFHARSRRLERLYEAMVRERRQGQVEGTED
jgi:glycosyltransferase involved in cell wall biosynthesis